MKIACGGRNFRAFSFDTGESEGYTDYQRGYYNPQKPHGATFERLKTTNGFEIEGLAARQAWPHFANICHVTLDTRPSCFFFSASEKG